MKRKRKTPVRQTWGGPDTGCGHGSSWDGGSICGTGHGCGHYTCIRDDRPGDGGRGDAKGQGKSDGSGYGLGAAEGKGQDNGRGYTGSSTPAGGEGNGNGYGNGTGYGLGWDDDYRCVGITRLGVIRP